MWCRSNGFSFRTTLAIVFICPFENTWLENCILPISNQLVTEDLLMIQFYSFEHTIMLKNLKIISTNNIKTWNVRLKLRKMVHCHFWLLLSPIKNNKFVTSVYRKPTFSEVFKNFEIFIPEFHKQSLFNYSGKNHNISIYQFLFIIRHFECYCTHCQETALN